MFFLYFGSCLDINLTITSSMKVLIWSTILTVCNKSIINYKLQKSSIPYEHRYTMYIYISMHINHRQRNSAGLPDLWALLVKLYPLRVAGLTLHSCRFTETNQSTDRQKDGHYGVIGKLHFQWEKRDCTNPKSLRIYFIFKCYMKNIIYDYLDSGER